MMLAFAALLITTIPKTQDTIRGREQHLIEHFGVAKSVGGTSGNAINGIGFGNKRRKKYLSESIKEFGKL